MSLKRATTPLRVPQILGGSTQGKDRDISIEKSTAQVKDGDSVKEVLNTPLARSCNNEVAHLIDILTEQCTKSMHSRTSAEVGLNDLQFHHMPMQLGCPGYLLIRPGYYRLCHIYHVDFIYRRAVIFMKGEVLAVPLASIRVNSYANLNSIFRNIFYEATKASVTGSELDIYKSSLRGKTDTLNKSIEIPWRNKYLLPTTFNDQLFKQNPVLKNGVCPNQHLVNLIKSLVKKECEQFKLTQSSRKISAFKINFADIEHTFVDELKCSVTGLANLQSDQFSITNSYFADIMVPSMYLSKNLLAFTAPKLPEESSELEVKYDLQDAEMHSLSSLYKFVIAKSIMGQALSTGKLDARHSYDHLRFYSRLSLNHTEGSRPFLDSAHTALDGVELFCSPPYTPPRFQDIHNNLLLCSKFDPTLVSFRDKVLRVVDYALYLLTPLPDTIKDLGKDIITEIPRLIVLSLTAEFPVDEEICESIRGDLQVLLHNDIALSSNTTSTPSLQKNASNLLPSDSAANNQASILAASESLGPFLSRHLPTTFDSKAMSDEYHFSSDTPFFTLLPVPNVAEHYYLTRVYFTERVIPVLLVSAITSLLQSSLVNYVANNIAPACISDSTFSVDFSTKVKGLQFQSAKEANEANHDRYDHILSSGLPLSVINVALSTLKSEGKDLSSGALLVRAFNYTWPRFLRTLIEQIKTHIISTFSQMHAKWSQRFLGSLTKIANFIHSDTSSLVCSPYTLSETATDYTCAGSSPQSISMINSSRLQKKLSEFSFCSYATESSILSVDSLILAPQLSFSDVSINKAAVGYIQAPNDILNKKARSLFFSDKYSFGVPTATYICEALLCGVKKIARTDSDELSRTIIQDLLLLNSDQETGKFFFSWIGPKQRQSNILGTPEPTVCTDIRAPLPPLCPTSRTEKPAQSTGAKSARHPNVSNDHACIKEAGGSSTVLIIPVIPSDDEVSVKRQIDSLFETISMKIVELLSICNNFDNFYRVFELIVGSGIMQDGLLHINSDVDSFSYVYSAPPECMLRMQISNEASGDGEQSTDACRVLNPYTSIGDDNAKVSPDFVRSLSNIEAVARDYVSAVLKGTSSKKTIISLANSSGIDPLVLTVHISAELVHAIDQQILDIYAIPSYVSVGVINVVLVDFKLSLISAFVTIRKNIYDSISKTIEQASSYMMRVMRATESMLGIATLNLDKLSQILIVMEDHSMFIKQWTPIACYLCDFLCPISRLYHCYTYSILCDIKKAITHTIPIIYRSLDSLGQENSKLDCSTINSTLKSQLNFNIINLSGLTNTSPLQADELHIALQAAARLGWANCAHKNARFNHKRHIRVFSRLLLVFSDWLSKIAGTLHAISAEVLKMQLSDFRLAVTNPLQFRKAFLAISKGIEIPYLEIMYSTFEGSDLLLVSEFIKTLQAYTCIHISINSNVVNGFSIDDIQTIPQENRALDTSHNSGRNLSSNSNRTVLDTSYQSNKYHIGWQIPYQGYRWPYFYARPSPDSISEHKGTGYTVPDPASALDYLLITDCNFESSERCDLFVLRNNDGLITASAYINGHLSDNKGCDDKGQETQIYQSNLPHYDIFRMFMELYILIEEIKNLYLRASSWSKALNIDMHLVDSPSEIEAVLLPPCLLVTSFVKLVQLYKAAPSKALIDMDAGVLVMLLEICATSISTIRSSFVYSNWTATADQIECYMRGINSRLFLLYFLASPNAIEEDLASFGEVTGLNAFLRGLKTSQESSVAAIDTYFEPDRAILVEHLFLYDNIDAMFEAAATIYARGLVNRQAMATLSKIDDWINELWFQPVTLTVSHKSAHILSALYSFWESSGKGEFSDRLTASKLGPVMGGKALSLTPLLQKVRTLMVAKEKVLEIYSRDLGVSDQTVEDSSLVSTISSDACVSDDVSADEETGDNDELFAMQTLDRNKDLFVGSIVLESETIARSRAHSIAGSFEYAAEQVRQHGNLSAREPLLGIPTIICSKRHIEYIREAIFVVAYILFNDYSSSIQMIARRLEIELILLHTLAIGVQRAITILPELLLLLPDLCSISSGAAHPRLKEAFPASEDPLLEVISLLNIMRQLNSFCANYSGENSHHLSSEGVRREARYDNGEVASLKGCTQSSILPTAGSFGALRAIVRQCPYIIRSLSLHIAQADNILGVFSNSILRFPLIPSLSSHLSLEYARIPRIPAIYYAQGQHYIVNLIRQCPLIRSAILYNNVCTSTSASLPSGKLRPIVFHTSNSAFSNSIYDIMTFRTGAGSLNRVQISGIRSGYENLRFLKPIDMPDTLLEFSTCIFAPSVHRAAMIKEYTRAIHLLIEEQYTRLIESCLYQCVHYALSTLVFMHLDGSPGNFLQLYYKCIPEFKKAVAIVAVKTGTIITDKSLSSCYSLRNYKHDRRVYVQALLARINEYERILHTIMVDSLTLYIMRAIPNLSKAATIEKVASFMSDEGQVRAAFTELYADVKSQACIAAMSCGIHPSAHVHHVISTLPYGLPAGSVFTTTSFTDLYGEASESSEGHVSCNKDSIFRKDTDALFVSCAEVAIPIVGQYTGKASLLDCIPLNYKQLQAVSRLGTSMQNRIPAFLVGDALRSYNNIDYLIIVHSLCRYFGMRYEFIFCSPATEANTLVNTLCTKILAGCYIVLCGIEFLGEMQLNSLSNVLSSYNLATGTIPTLERADKGQLDFSILQSIDKDSLFLGGYAICLPEAIYEGSKFSLTVKGETLRKLFPIHNLIEVKDCGTTVPASLIQQTKALLYDFCLEARGSADKADMCSSKNMASEKQITEFFDEKNLSKEYHSAISGEIQISALNLDALYPHCSYKHQNETNLPGYLFMQSSSQYGSKLYEVSMFLNTAGLSTPQLRPEDVNIVFKRCKDVTNPISVATSLSAYLLSQVVLRPARDIVSRVIEGAFSLQPQHKVILNSVVSLLNVLHGVQEPDETDIGILISRKTSYKTDNNFTANNITKVWKTLKQMYTPAHAEFCENMSKKSTLLEPVGVDALTLCLEMLSLGPVFLIPPSASALQGSKGVKLTVSQLSNKNITTRLAKSGALSSVTLRQSYLQLLVIFSQLVARIGKLRPFFIHSLADLHENIRTIMYLGSQALLIFIFNPPNGAMARSMLSAVTALQSYYPELELYHNIKAKFDFFNKPRCLLLATSYENGYVINSNLASVQRRLIVIPEYLKFSTMLNNYIGRHLHLTEDKQLTEKTRKMFTVTSLIDMKTPALSAQYLQSLCSRRTAADLKGECLAEKRLRLGSRVFGVLIACLTDEMMRNIFNIVPSPVVWTLYRQLLVLFLTSFKVITLSPCHPEAYATFESIPEVKSTQTYQPDSYLSLHTIVSSTPLAGYDSDMQIQSAPRAMFFNASFSISYLQSFVYEAVDNTSVIVNLFLPAYAAIFNALHTLHIMYFRRSLNKLSRIYKRGLAALIYRPEKFVSRIMSMFKDSTHIFSQPDLDSAIALLPDLFPEHYADEDDTLSAYSYLGVSDSDGSFIHFLGSDKGKKLFVRHFPYTCSSGLFSDTSFENLFSQHTTLKHELILTFDSERILFVIYLSSFIMAKLSVCLIGEAFSGKSTYIRAAEVFLSNYVWREHIALFDTDSFNDILQKLMKTCYLHNIQTTHPKQTTEEANKAQTEHKDESEAIHHPLSFRKEVAGACSIIGCPISILNVVEDNTLLDEAKDIHQGIIMDAPSSKLPLYHLTVTNLLTNTATHNVPDDVLTTKDTADEMKASMLGSLGTSTNASHSQTTVNNDKLSILLGEKYIVMEDSERSTVCSLTGVVGARFSSGIFMPNVSLVVETSYLHDFLLTSEINFVLPPMNNTREFLLLLLKRNFQHPSIDELDSIAPKIVQARIKSAEQSSTNSAQVQQKRDCNLYIGIKRPEKEFLHEYSDFYFMQFVEGLLLVEYQLPISLLRIVCEIKKLRKYISPIDLSNIQLNTLSLGSFMGALRNIPAITHSHVSRILDELASAVAIGRLAPHGPYGPLNPENMGKYLRANTLIAMSLYPGVQAFPSWEIQILDAAFKQSLGDKELSNPGVSKASDATDTSNDGDKYKRLVGACEKARKRYAKLLFYNPHDRCVNHKVFDVHLSVMHDYLMGLMDPTVCNRVFTFIIDVSTLMEHNSLKVFSYIKYLRNPGLFSKLRSPTDAKNMQTLALQVPVFLLSQSEMPGTFYSLLLHAIQTMGNYKVSNKKTFMKVAKQAFSSEVEDFETNADSHENSFSCSVSTTSLPKTISTRSLSGYDGPLLAHAIKNSDLRAFLSITEELTEVAIKRRQRILIDTQTMIQSLINQTVDVVESSSESECDSESGLDASKSLPSQSRPVTTTATATALEDFMTELIEALVSVLNIQSEVVASRYIIRAAVLIALGINPLIAFRDFTPTSSTNICDCYSSIIPDYLLQYVNKGNLEINANEYTDLFLSTPTDIMVTIPMSLFNALLNKSPAIGILSIVEAGSSLLSLFTTGEVHVLGALLAKYFCFTTMLSGKEIINILSRSFSLVIFADTSINHPLPLQELPIIRHTIDENEKIGSLYVEGNENILQNSYKASGTVIPNLQLIRSIPYFILSNIRYNFDSKYFIAQHEQSETPLHDAYSDMYREIFCRTTLCIYNCCIQNVSDSIPYSLARFSEIATYYTNEIIMKHLRTITFIQKILSSVTLFDNGIRNGLFSPSIRNDIIYLRDQLVSVKLKLKLDFIRAVMMLQNACCDGPLIAARLLFYPFTTSTSGWGNCRQFEMGLFECLKNRKITNNSLNTSYSDNSTIMLQSLFNLSANDELIQRSDMLSNYGLPSRLLMICEDLMRPKWRTQLICSLCNPDPRIVQTITITIHYIKLGFKFLFVTDDLARIVIPACEVYLLEASLDDCMARLSAIGVNAEKALEKYNSTGVMTSIIDEAVPPVQGSCDDIVGASEKSAIRQKEIRCLLSELEGILKKINDLKYSAASYKNLPSNVRFGAPSTCYNYQEVHKKLLIYLDCHLPPSIFEALLKYALLQDKPLVFLNFGSTTMPLPNMMIMMKLALLIESRMTKKNAKVSVTTTYSVDIVRPLHDYRMYYVVAPGSSFKFVLEIGFINLRNCDISALNAPKFQFKSNSINLLRMQDPSVTEYELRYKLQEISEKFSSVYSLYVNGFDGLEIIRRESCLERSEKLYKYIEQIANDLEEYVFSRKEIMHRLMKREESNAVFVHIQRSSGGSDGLDFAKMSLCCAGIERCIEYREEIAKKITENSTVSIYAEYFGTAITSILLLLRQMSLIHPNMVSIFTDHFFECHLSYLDDRVGSNPSRAFTVIVNTAHYILENTVLLLPERERGPYTMLFMSIYNLCFKLGRPDDLTHLKVMLANDLGFFISHFSDRFNNHLPLYNHARQIAANCPSSFRCSPNVVYSWKLFSLISIYNPHRFSEWYEYFTHNKAVFTLLNFAGDAYKMIIGTYLYKERAAQANDKAKHTLLDAGTENVVVSAVDPTANVVDLNSSVTHEIEDDMGNLKTTHLPIVPPYAYDELETYSIRMVPLPPGLQHPSFENIWVALLLIVSLRQDLVTNAMEFFCKITPPSAIYKFLQDNAALHTKEKSEWCSTKNEAVLLTSDIFSRVVSATAMAIDSINNTTTSDLKTIDQGSLHAEGCSTKMNAADDAGVSSEPISLSSINPANLDHVTRLFKHLQRKYNLEATQQTSLGHGSRAVLLYYDEGLAILPFLREVFTKEIGPKYSFPNYVCQPAPAAECFSTSVVIVDTRYNPYYSLSHLIKVYKAGVRPTYLMYVLVPLSCCQKFGTESGAATANNVGLQLATFIEVCRPIQLYIQRPTVFLDAMQHSISTMRSYTVFHPASCSVYESSFIKALTLLALRHSVLVSNSVLRVDDNEMLLLYIHLVSQMKTLPYANQGRRLFFAKKQGANPHTVSMPMMHSILFHMFSDITTSNTLSNIYSSICHKSSAILIGSPIKTSTSVAVSYLNNKSLHIASFYGDAAIDTHIQAEKEQNSFDLSFSSMHNSETELTNSRSVFSSAESSLDDVSICSYKTDHTYTDQIHMDEAQQTTNPRIMAMAGDDTDMNALFNATGPDRFKSYSRVELQRFLSGRRHLVTVHASSRMDSLLHFPETMSENNLIELMDKIRLITVDLDRFAMKHTNIAEIIRTQELQGRLADTLQPIHILRPGLSRCQNVVRDAFTFMLSNDVLSNISSQPMHSHIYSTVEVDRAEKALPSIFHANLLLSKTYQRVRKLTHGFTSSSCVGQPCPIKILSGNIWTVRGDIYQPIMHDILKFFKLQMCLKYNMEMEYHSVVFTLLDPTYYKDWFLRYDGQNCIQCSRIDSKRQKRKYTMPLAAVKVTNMRLYGIGYDYILNTIVDVSPESLSYPNNCDIYAILVPCESPSSLMPAGSVKTKDSYSLIYETLSYSSSPLQCEDELAEIDQDFGVDHYYENSIQHVKIPVDFPGCWYLILQNKTSLKESDIDAKSPYCGTGYF